STGNLPMLPTWLRALLGRNVKPGKNRRPNRQGRHLCRPRLELLEDRLAPANIFWGGGGANNNFNNGANWGRGTAPGTSDIAIFDPSQASGAPSPNKDATIDTSISVRGLFVEGTYTGTVTEPAASTVTLGSSGFFQSNGTFTVSGSGSITDSN